ncbi:MAG: Type II secretion system protein F [Chlamydiae bacterium]|nr:Type II secretion system protein F [Chlamydiota bacterium]
MAIYSFRAYNDQGQTYRAKLEAPSLLDAKKQLIEKGIQLIQINPCKYVKVHKPPFTSLLSFTRELLQLIEAGLPLFQSINLLKEQFSNDKIADILFSISESLESGSSFSATLDKHPRSFSTFYRTLIQVGEKSGQLDHALKRIVQDYERQEKLKKQVRAALLYPSILLIFCIILIHIMILYIVPSLENLFEGSSNRGLTQTVIAWSHHLKKWEAAYLLSAGSAFIVLKWKLRQAKVKSKLDTLFLKIPLLKPFLLDLALSKFCSTMEVLLKGGVPLLESLSQSKQILSNQVLKEIISEIECKIESGHSLSEEFQKQPLFPKILCHIIKVGESSGELIKSFERLASIYEASVEKKLSKLMTLLSPLILLIMGLLIGTIMLGILIPLTDINSLAI